VRVIYILMSSFSCPEACCMTNQVNISLCPFGCTNIIANFTAGADEQLSIIVNYTSFGPLVGTPGVTFHVALNGVNAYTLAPGHLLTITVPKGTQVTLKAYVTPSVGTTTVFYQVCATGPIGPPPRPPPTTSLPTFLFAIVAAAFLITIVFYLIYRRKPTSSPPRGPRKS